MTDPNQTPQPDEPVVAEESASPHLTANQFDDELSHPEGVEPSDEDPTYSALPSDDELSRASPDSRGLIPLLGVGRDDLQKLYERRISQVGPERFLIQAAISGSYENLLWFSLNNFSAEAERAQDAIAQIKDKSTFSYRLEKDGKVLIGNTNFRQQKPTETKMVSGEAGMVEMLGTRKGQIRRIPLYNSGFCLDIRNTNPDDLSTLMRRCRADLAEYGREFGSHFYAYADLILKRTFFDSLLTLSIGSTLKNWKKPGSLASRIKLPDYDVILTNLAGLMFPEGYPDFRHSCTRPADTDHPSGCDHVTTINADLTQLIHINYPALNEVAVAHMVKARTSMDPIGPKELEAYQKELGFEDTVITFDDFEFTMTVPSMADYFAAGEVFNADLLNEISANNRKEIYDAIAFREGRLYLPWIKRMTRLTDAGTPGLVTEDKTVISFILDTLATDDKARKLISEFIAFINRSKLSHICYRTFACEKCGYEPPSQSGFLTVDPQHSFFIQSTQKLTRS